MKVAFSTISCPHYSAAQVAGAAHTYGYDGVELYALEGQRLLPEMLAEKLAELKRELSGVPIVSVNSWGVLSSPDHEERAEQEKKIGRTFELAVELRSPLVKTFGGDLPELPLRQVYSFMGDTLGRLGDRARSLGVTLLVETHDGFCKGETLAGLLAGVPHNSVGALWDVHHPYRKGEMPNLTDTLIGERVRHIHVKDAIAVKDEWKFVLLGEGELPVRQVLRLMAQRGFSGYVALDWELMWHPEIAPAEVALPHYLKVLRHMIAEEEAAGAGDANRTGTEALG